MHTTSTTVLPAEPESWRSRLRQIVWRDSTRPVELGVVLILTARGIWLLNPYWPALPGDVKDYYVPPGIGEMGWGGIMLVAAGFQFWSALSGHAMIRALVATGVAALFAMKITAYIRADLPHRHVFGFLVAALVMELWVAWRGWNEAGRERRTPVRELPPTVAS